MTLPPTADLPPDAGPSNAGRADPGGLPVPPAGGRAYRPATGSGRARRGAWSWLDTLPDRFLPDGFPADRHSQIRARILIVIGPLLGLGAMAWGLGAGIGLGIAKPPYIGLILLMLVGSINSALPFLLRRGLPLTALSGVLVATFFVQGFVAWWFGGGRIWDFMQVVPVGIGLACFTISMRAGLRVALALLAALAAMFWLKATGHVPPSRLPADLQDLMHYYRAGLATAGVLLIVANVLHVNDRMEARYAEAQAAAEAGLRARSRFLGTVSHELRTPIAGMMGSIALLEGSSLERQQRDWLAALRLSTEALSGILNDLLNLSRLEAGERRDRPQPMAPATLVEEVFTLFSAQAASKGIWLRRDLDPELPSHLSVDVGALRQVLINLVGNAVRATDAGGVTIAARCLTARYGLNLMVTVRDTGHGFDPAENPLLAVAPESAGGGAAAPPGNAVQRGTGGLAICARLIAGMGGRLEAFGMPGAGASFRLTVPVERLHAPGRMSPMPVSARAPGRRLGPVAAAAGALQATTSGYDILVAEDSDTNRMLLGALLERIGHRPHLVADGTAALAAVRAAERGRNGVQAQDPDRDARLPSEPPVPDLLLLDIQMPGLTGTEVARAVRIVPGPLQRIPILGLTADATPEHRQGYLDAGLDDLLYKPVRLPELQAAIERLMQQSGENAASSGSSAS
ncbi:histidine kinase dimerization/phospho-acceptor domain-containing protein [Marinibaculum pumilum]|uniref:histidine kinase n=1 Tax=Marinibaculum pumilum TaxID=1766165 RepID=A0ABV7L3F3_9PROT